MRTTPLLMRAQGVPHADIAWRLGDADAPVVGEERFSLHGAQLVRHAPTEARLAFRVSSVSKAVVALAALALARDGVLPLDEPLESTIAQVLTSPEARLAPGTSMRLLLSHAAGLAEHNPPRVDAGLISPAPIEAWLATPDAQRLIRQVEAPGRQTQYSSVGYALVQLAIERRLGEALPAIVRRLVLEPLGVAAAFEQELWGKQPTRVLPAIAPDHDAEGSVLAVEPYVCAGSSGLVASPHDICKVLHRGLFGGFFLPPALASGMLTAQPSNLPRAIFSMSLRLHGGGTHDPGGPIDARSLTHAGLRPGHASVVVVVPERRAVLCAATSARAGSAVCKPLTGLFREMFVGV